MQAHGPPLHGAEELLHTLAHKLRGQGAAELGKRRRHVLRSREPGGSVRWGQVVGNVAPRHTSKRPSHVSHSAHKGRRPHLEREGLDAAQSRPVSRRLHEAVQRTKEVQAVLLECLPGHRRRGLPLVLPPGYAQQADKERETAHHALHAVQGVAGPASGPLRRTPAPSHWVQDAVEVAEDGRVESLRWRA